MPQTKVHRRMAVGALLVALLGSACAQLERGVFGDPVASSAAPVESPPPAAWADDVEAGVCVDPSASVPRDMFEESVQTVAQLAETWPRPVEPSVANPPWPGLQLTVRAIGEIEETYGYRGLLVRGSIPGIPSVIEPGDPVAPNFVEWDAARREQLQAAQRAFRDAERAAQELASSVEALDPPVAYRSGVWSCVSAMAELGVGRLGIVSDLQQRGEPQIAGSLDGVSVLVVLICFEAAPCDRTKDRWSEWLFVRGATEVTFVRFEELAPELEQFLKEV